MCLSDSERGWLARWEDTKHKTQLANLWIFLAVQTFVWDSSIPTPVTTYIQTDKGFYFLTLQSNPRDLWPLRHLIRVMRRHDLTKKITHLPTYLPTYPPTHLPTSVGEHPQGAILETCDLWDICSEWWGDMTWAKKTMSKTKTMTKTITLKNTFKERSLRLVTFETFVQSDEETRHGQRQRHWQIKDHNKYMTKIRNGLWACEKLLTFQTIKSLNSWQLRVTLDSIYNFAVFQRYLVT